MLATQFIKFLSTRIRTLDLDTAMAVPGSRVRWKLQVAGLIDELPSYICRHWSHGWHGTSMRGSCKTDWTDQRFAVTLLSLRLLADILWFLLGFDNIRFSNTCPDLATTFSVIRLSKLLFSFLQVTAAFPWT